MQALVTNIVRLFPILFLWTLVSFASVETACADETPGEPATIRSIGNYAASEMRRNADDGVNVSLHELDLTEGHITPAPADKAAITNKWSSVKSDHGISTKFVWRWILIAAMAVSGILLLFLLRTNNLKKRVSDRTNEVKVTSKSLEFEIARRKQAEKALASSESKYRGLVENSLLGIFSTNLAGQFSFINDAMVQIFDFDSTEQMLAINSHSLWANLERRKQMLSLLNEHARVDKFEAELLTRTGRNINVLFSATLFDENITGMGMEITDRKHTERSLKDSEALFRMIYEYAPVMIDAFDDNGRCTMWNRECEKVFGWSAEEIYAYENPLELFYPDPDVQKQVIASTVSKPEQIFREWKPKSKDGSERVCLWANFKLPDGKIINLGHDITERKQAEEELLRSESKYRTLLENLPQKIFLKDTHSTYISCNENFARDRGITPEEIVGKRDDDFFPRELADQYRDDDRRILESGQTERLEEQYLQEGKKSWVATIKTPVLDDNGVVTGLLGAFLDITERKQAEQKLQQYQQRLKSLAVQLTLAEEQERRRIAEDLHDHIGQSLALARMQLAAARKGLLQSDKRNAQFDDISKSLLKAIQDTRHLIFELSSPSLNELGLAAAISEWMDEYVVNKHGIEAELFDHAQDSPLDSDLRAILFRNVRELLSNAIKHARAKTISVWLESGAENFKITIQDDGVGFDSGNCWRSGDDCGGFGLFSVRERMSDLGGKLTISSQPGAGCKAVLDLPLHKQDPETEA